MPKITRTNKFSNFTISNQVLIIILLVCFISIVITATAIAKYSVYSMRNELVEEINIDAKIAGARNARSLLYNNGKEAYANLQMLVVDKKLNKVCIYNLKGMEFASYFAKDAEKTCPEYKTLTFTGNDVSGFRTHYAYTSRKIKHKTDYIGAIYLETDLDKINKQISNYGFTILIATLLGLIIASLLAIILRRYIASPISQLTETVKKVTKLSDYSIRANFNRGETRTKTQENEIKTLFKSVNSMLEEIQTHEKMLLTKNRQLREAKNQAEDASRAKSRFLANVSHELRTPLNAIIGFSEIIEQQVLGEIRNKKYVEYVHDINHSGNHLLEIINDILDLSKAESGRMELNLDNNNPRNIVNACITIVKETIKTGKLELLIDIEPKLPTIYADKLRLKQIFLNILSNSIKFTEEGGIITIKARLKKYKNGKQFVVFTFKDSGIGMTQEEQRVAFSSFVQIDSGLNRKYSGTGLGLPLIKQLVRLHHGKIKLVSQKNEGTKIDISIPVSTLSDKEADKLKKARKSLADKKF